MSEHGDAVWRACAAYVPAYDAEDALQNTFLKYAMHDQDFSSAEHEKAWLLTVAANLSKNIIRSRSRSSGPVPEDICGEGIPEENIELKDAVTRLPEIYREVIQLFYYQDLSIAETAAVLGEKESTVKSKLRRARGLLGGILRENRKE